MEIADRSGQVRGAREDCLGFDRRRRETQIEAVAELSANRAGHVQVIFDDQHLGFRRKRGHASQAKQEACRDRSEGFRAHGEPARGLRQPIGYSTTRHFTRRACAQ
jgi:hypothetical protein